MFDPNQRFGGRNLVEQFLRYIPGFRGYLEKEYRRESDELLRQWLADQLAYAKRSLDDVSRGLTQAAQIEPLPQIDRLRGRVDALIGRIRGAMEGYSGLFDLVRIDESVLDRVYSHDLELIEEVKQWVGKVRELPDRADRLPELLREAHGTLEGLHRRWDRREEVLRGLE